MLSCSDRRPMPRAAKVSTVAQKLAHGSRQIGRAGQRPAHRRRERIPGRQQAAGVARCMWSGWPLAAEINLRSLWRDEPHRHSSQPPRRPGLQRTNGGASDPLNGALASRHAVRDRTGGRRGRCRPHDWSPSKPAQHRMARSSRRPVSRRRKPPRYLPPGTGVAHHVREHRAALLNVGDYVYPTHLALGDAAQARRISAE